MDDLGSVVADVTVAVEAMEADYETMAVAMPLTVTVTVITIITRMHSRITRMHYNY